MKDVEFAWGVYWSSDAPGALHAKSRDIKSQLETAMHQFNSKDTAVIHIAIETYDGPQVEMTRLEKINNTVKKVFLSNPNLKWIFCTFFQAYSPPDQLYVFDETISSMSSSTEEPPLSKRLMIITDDGDFADNIYHWERPLP